MGNPKQRQPMPRYPLPPPVDETRNPPGCTQLETTINRLAGQVNGLRAELRNIQKELEGAYLDCTAERAAGWIGYFWPACRRLIEKQNEYKAKADKLKAAEGEWNAAVESNAKFACNYPQCPPNDNRYYPPLPSTQGGDWNVGDDTGIIKDLEDLYEELGKKLDHMMNSWSFLASFFGLLSTQPQNGQPGFGTTSVPYIKSWSNTSPPVPEFGWITGPDAWDKLFQTNGVFGPGWQGTLDGKLPGTSAYLQPFATEIENSINSNMSKTEAYQLLKKIIKNHRKQTAAKLRADIDRIKACRVTIKGLIEQLTAGANKQEMAIINRGVLGNQINKIFADNLSYDITGTPQISYSPANTPTTSPGLQVSISTQQAKSIVKQERNANNMITFSLDESQIAGVLTQIKGPPKQCEDDEGMGAWYRYPIKANITITPVLNIENFKRALDQLSIPGLQIVWKDPNNTTVSCDNLPTIKSINEPGKVKLFNKPLQNIKDITTIPTLTPRAFEVCEGRPEND